MQSVRIPLATLKNDDFAAEGPNYVLVCDVNLTVGTNRVKL